VCSNCAGRHHMNQWDLLRSDGNPATNAQRPHIAMMCLHDKPNTLSTDTPNEAKQGTQAPAPNTAADPPQIVPKPISDADLPPSSESDFFRIIPFFLVEKRHM
jgi:hypothetical protein